MWRSLGKVDCTVANQLYRITVNESDSAARYPCFAILFEQIPENAGYFYVFDRPAGVVATLVGCVAIIPVPAENASSKAVMLPYATVTCPQGAAPMNAADYYVASSDGGEGILVSAVRL